MMTVMWCAAGCGEKVRVGDGHTYRIGDKLIRYHVGCCPLCPRKEGKSIPV